MLELFSCITCCKRQIIAALKDFIVMSLGSSAQSAYDLTLRSYCGLFQLMLCHHVPLCSIYFWYFILLHNKPHKENLTHCFLW